MPFHILEYPLSTENVDVVQLTHFTEKKKRRFRPWFDLSGQNENFETLLRIYRTWPVVS